MTRRIIEADIVEATDATTFAPVTHQGGDGRVSLDGLSDALGRALNTFSDVRAMLEDETRNYTVGTDGHLPVGASVYAGPLQYTVSAESSMPASMQNSGGYHVETAGGLKLRAKPTAYGFLDVQFGAFGDAGVDDLPALQMAVDVAALARRPLSITRKHYLQIGGPENVRGLVVRDNSEIIFEDNGELELLSHNTNSYQILRLYYIDTATVINPRVNGRRDLNAASASGSGFGHGIGLRGTRGKIRIINPVTNNCWGDGIYIGDGRGDPVEVDGWPVSNEDVYISNHFSDNNRRQGMSIIAAKRLVVDNPVWQNTNGTNPEAGCDIEPNSPGCDLEFIRIKSPRTENNSGAGILLWLNNLSGGDATKKVDIVIDNHLDEGSNDGFRAEGRYTTNVNMPVGRVVVNNPTWRNNQGPNLRARAWADEQIELVINEPVLINANSAGAAPGLNVNFNSSLVFERQSTDSDLYPIGGMRVINPTILAPDTTPSRPIWLDDSRGVPIRNVDIIDPIRVEGGFNRIDTRYRSIGGIVSDVRESWRHDVAASTTIGSSWARVAGSTRTSLAVWTLPQGVVGEPPFTFVNVGHAEGASGLRIAPPSGGRFMGQPVDAYYQCPTSRGHRMTVTPLGDGVWRIDELVGQWQLTDPAA